MKVRYSDKDIWKLAEVYAFAVTGLDKTMKSFWPWDTSGNYSDHNYPELVKIQKELQGHALKLSIREFIKRGPKNETK